MPGLGGAIAEQRERTFDELADPDCPDARRDPAALPSMPAASSEATSFRSEAVRLLPARRLPVTRLMSAPRNLRKLVRDAVVQREAERHRPENLGLRKFRWFRGHQNRGRQWPRCRGAIRRPLRRGRSATAAGNFSRPPAILP